MRGVDGSERVSIVLLNLAENYIHRATDDRQREWRKRYESNQIRQEIVDVYPAGD